MPNTLEKRTENIPETKEIPDTQTCETNGNISRIQKIDKNPCKITYYYLLQVEGDPTFKLRAESTRKNGVKAEFTPVGWAYQKEEDAKEVAIRWTQGKRKLKVVKWFDEFTPLLDKIWNGSKYEAKTSKKQLENEVKKHFHNKKKNDIETQCNQAGLHPSWLTRQSLPDYENFTEKEKKTHAHFKPLWDKTLEEQENIDLRDADIAREIEDTKEEKNTKNNDLIVGELNKKHAVIHIDQFYILTEKPHSLFNCGTDFTLESKQSFLNTYENQIPAWDARSIAKIWLSHQNRRQYNGITFDPTTTEHKNGLYNIWKGFACKPIKGSCELYKDHIKNVICSGNPEYYTYVWNWLAHLVQKPDRIATSLVLMGKQGTGKNKFVDSIGYLFGAHYLPLDNIQQLLGQFNFHLKNAVLIHANEAIWGGNKKEIGVLKSMITDEYSVIEGKGKDRIIVRNFKHVIISSNEDWPVHLDRDDRRFLVLPVSDKHKEDIAYFKTIDAELKNNNNSGYSALLNELQKVDISNYDPRILPNNTDAFNVKMMSATSSEKYIYEVLLSGCFDIGNASISTNWQKKISTHSVFIDYQSWCATQGLISGNKEALGKSIMKLIKSTEKNRPRSEDGSRTSYYNFPDLEKARNEFQKEYKVGVEIWE